MNQYFYKIFLPYSIFAILGLLIVIQEPFLLVSTFLFWLIIGFVGLGVGFHRLFSHRCFETYKPVEYMLALIGTLSTYAPILFWVGNHSIHHKYADTERDPHNPNKGFWHTLIYWNLKKDIEKQLDIYNFCARKILRDKFLMFLNKHFIIINYVFFLILMIIDYQIALGGYALACFIEKIRIGLVNYIFHSDKFIGSYRLHDTSDNSQNNIIFLPLMGFNLHNTHHKSPFLSNEAILKFEVDLEYFIIRLIRKRLS